MIVTLFPVLVGKGGIGWQHIASVLDKDKSFAGTNYSNLHHPQIVMSNVT